MSARAAAKTSVLCVAITYPVGFAGALQGVFLTDASNPVVIPFAGLDRTFQPDEFLAYESVERGASLEEDSGTLTTSTLWDFAARALRGDTMAPLTVHVMELIIEEVDDLEVSTVSMIHWDRGSVSAVTNADGVDVGACKWTILNFKTDADRTLDTRVTETCKDRLGGGKVCKFDLEANRSSVTLTAFDGLTITATGLRAEPNVYWVEGYVLVNGIRIQIRAADGDQLTLYSPLPEDMRITIAAGTPIVARVYPGCSGTLEECSIFGQTQNFWGVGIAIENRNPLFQLPR